MIVEPGFFRTDLLTPESTSYADSTIGDYAASKDLREAGQFAGAR